MHELSIAMSLLETASEEAERRGASGVNTIYLKVGPLSGVVEEALHHAYELARETMAMNETRLIIEPVQVTAYCPTCEGERAVVSIQQVRCQDCGTPTPQILTGRELQVTALEIAQ